MRLLHTADWHLGRRLFGIERLTEAASVLREIAEIAARERVDAVLVAGDILDRRIVEPDVLATCLDAFEALAEVAPVVVVTGNHDDPAFWRPLVRYLEPRRIVVRSTVREPRDAIVHVTTEGGTLNVAALPWPDPASLPVVLGASARDAHGAYGERLGELVSAYGEALRDARRANGGASVLLGHVMVASARAGGGERELTLGDTYAIRRERLPQDLDYVALGHVHLAQRVPGLGGEGRYCGAPMQLDFGEAGVDPRVAVVDIDANVTRVREVPILTGRRLIRLRGPLDAVVRDATEHPSAWFLCEVDVDRVVPDLVRDVRELVPDALRVVARYPDETADTASEATGRTAGAGLPVGLVDRYTEWYGTLGWPLDDAQARTFASLLDDR